MLMDDGNWQEVTSVLEGGARRNKIEDSRQSSCKTLSRGRKKLGESRNVLAKCTGSLTMWPKFSIAGGHRSRWLWHAQFNGGLNFCHYLIAIMIFFFSSFAALEMTHFASSGQNHHGYRLTIIWNQKQTVQAGASGSSKQGVEGELPEPINCTWL